MCLWWHIAACQVQNWNEACFSLTWEGRGSGWAHGERLSSQLQSPWLVTQTRTAGRGGLALGPACRPPPWGTPSPLPLPPRTPLLRPCPSPGGALGQLLLAWTALIFPLLIIRSCLWRRQTGAPGGRPAQAQVRGSAVPGVWLVGAGHKGFLYKARAFALSF